MIGEFLIAIFVGILSGIITGLIPGIHVNLASILFFEILSNGSLNFDNNALFVVVAISAMMSTHIFIDNIPSMFLGAPDEGTSLNVLPGHRLLLNGNSLVGIESVVFGSLASMILGVLLLPLLFVLLKFFYTFSKPFTPVILIFISIVIILSEKDNNLRFWSFFVFLLSGILGFFTLRMPFLRQPLLPLLSGFFGISILLESFFSKPYIPKQNYKVEFKINPLSFVAGFFSGALTAIFPTITSSIAAIFGKSVLKKTSEIDFLNIVGSVNASNIFLTTIFLLITGKARNGALVVISKIVVLNLTTTLIIISAILFSSGIASLLCLKISKIFSRIISRIDYAMVSLAMIVFISIVIIIFSGFLGFIIMIVSSSIGFFSQSLNVKRIVLMGCLIFPVLLNYLI
ncbi:MAG: tripartite tricarboxylate transporter permease [Candidatus Woesearchaeota archaeon]